MSQFRDIAMLVLLVLGFALAFTNPDDWTWAAAGGPYLEQAISFLSVSKPFSTMICFALSLTLFMTRLKY